VQSCSVHSPSLTLLTILQQLCCVAVSCASNTIAAAAKSRRRALILCLHHCYFTIHCLLISASFLADRVFTVVRWTNDLDLCLEVVLRSCHCQLLRQIRHWISRKPLEIEAWFQRTTSRKWPMRNQIITWPRPMTSVTPKGQTLDPNALRARWATLTFNLAFRWAFLWAKSSV